MHATLRNWNGVLKTINTTLTLSVSVLYQIQWCFSHIIYLNSSKFIGTLEAQYLFAQAKKFGFLQLFRGLTRKKTRIFKCQQTRPKKTRPLKCLTRPDPPRSGRVSGRVPVRVKALNGHPNLN